MSFREKVFCILTVYIYVTYYSIICQVIPNWAYIERSTTLYISSQDERMSIYKTQHFCVYFKLVLEFLQESPDELFHGFIALALQSKFILLRVLCNPFLARSNPNKIVIFRQKSRLWHIC